MTAHVGAELAGRRLAGSDAFAVAARFLGKLDLASSQWRPLGRRGVRPAPQKADAAADDVIGRIADIVRLYGLVLETTPDRPGLRHHVELLADGHTLSDLATSLLAIQAGTGDQDDRPPVEIAAALWSRDGRGRRAFAPAWRRARDLPHFVASLVRDASSRSVSPLAGLFPKGVDPTLDDIYPAWAYRLWSAENERVLTEMARRLTPFLKVAGPRIVLRLDLGAETRATDLAATLSSVAGQIYGRWSLVLTGPLPAGFTMPRDPRIGRVRSGPRPSLHGTLRPGDTLSPACLALFAFAALRRPGVDRWSCDQDRRDPAGSCVDPQLDLVKREGLVLTRRGAATPGSTASGSRARHLPAVLLHRLSKTVPARAPLASPGTDMPSVSVVIATRDKPDLLRRCIVSLQQVTAGPRIEIVLVDNGSTDPAALSLLASLEAQGCKVLRRPGAFNWSRLNNHGVRASSGEVVVLLNNDIECIAPDWLGTLVRACLDPAVGPVGAELLYADGTVQHAGVLIGPGPRAAHRWSDGKETGSRPVSAVTGACMAFRRQVFDRLGGLDEALPVTWNDLDFCLRARAAGFDVILCSDAVLRHHELGTRMPDSAPENLAQLSRTRAHIARRHARALRRDPFLHPFALIESGGRLLDPRASRRIRALLRSGGVD